MEQQISLFDQNLKPVRSAISLANKAKSYYSKDVQRKKLTQKERVYEAIASLGAASDREISEETGIARHLIPDRRKSLNDLITVAFSKTDPVTNKLVTYYKINWR